MSTGNYAGCIHGFAGSNHGRNLSVKFRGGRMRYSHFARRIYFEIQSIPKEMQRAEREKMNTPPPPQRFRTPLEAPNTYIYIYIQITLHAESTFNIKDRLTIIQIFAEGKVIIDEYSPRRSRAEYSPITTEINLYANLYSVYVLQTSLNNM